MGLAVLDHFPSILVDRKIQWQRYANVFTTYKGCGLLQVDRNLDYNHSYFPLVFDSYERMCKAQDALLSENIFSRRYFYPSQEKQTPPRHGAFRPKLRYAHQGGSNPPIIVIHGNALEHIPASYTRYLERYFLEAFKLQGTPLSIQYKTSKNPFSHEGRPVNPKLRREK